MPTSQLNKVIQRLWVIAHDDGEGLSDAQLLARFLTGRNEAAFESLVRRHGPMVLGVCRRVLKNADDADDVFQATFLVLVRKAASITKRETVGGWLHGVAYKTALKARAASDQRRRKERQASAMSRREAPAEHGERELHELLDEELSRLADKYRIPIVLCDLEGKTRKEAANQLGWPEGTLSGRLSRARALLAKRLTRHGLTLAGGIAALGLAGSGASACLPSALVASTVKAASCLAAGQTAVAGAIPVKVAALMDGVLKNMLLTKLKIAAAVMLMVGMLGGGLLAPLALSETPAETKPKPQAKNAEQPKPSAKKAQLPAEVERAIQTDDAVAAGLQWLVRQQERDGRWRLKGSSQRNDVAATAFALLPLLAAGHTHKVSDALHPYARAVERGLKFLANGQNADGAFTLDMYAHALASQVVCAAYTATADPALKAPAQRAIDFIVKAQHEAGGWRYAPGQAGDTSVTSYQVRALALAQQAGLTVPRKTLTLTGKYLDSAASQDSSSYGYVPGSPPSPTMTAAGLLCRLELGGKTDDKGLLQWAARLREQTPLKGNYYLYCCHYVTLVLQRRGGTDWDLWESKIRKGLLDKQIKGEKPDVERGSWPTTEEPFRSQGGPLITTSLALLTLQTCARTDKRPSSLARELTAHELVALYGMLGSGDFVSARRALRTLAASPRYSVPFLRKEMSPVPPLDLSQIERWIAELDDDKFVVRQRAVANLEQLGELVHPALRKALANKPTVEARHRMEEILEVTDVDNAMVATSAQRRWLRAVEVLIQVGGPEARCLLEKLATGAPESRVTQAARRGLQRPRSRWSKDDVGKLPSGWKAAQTGKGEGSVWKIVADDSAPSKSGFVLAQTAESPRGLFNLCVADDGAYKDVEAQVAFKAVQGKIDQGGGIVWRYRDANNYYVARVNPLESNYRVYKVVDGKRIQLGTKEDLKVPAGEWHVLKIKQTGEQIECWLDGKKYLDVKDGAFVKAGKVGLWTKADAQTYFDDLRVMGR